MPQTRSQQDYALAMRHVSEVMQEPEEVKKIYGGLCHDFPVLVRTVGLAQATAYHASKASGQGRRARAHRLLLDHFVHFVETPGALEDYARTVSTMEYMLATRRVLDGAIFFKRLAVSVLGATSTTRTDSDET